MELVLHVKTCHLSIYLYNKAIRLSEMITISAFETYYRLCSGTLIVMK
jgi:hypothetical protein